MISGQKIQLRQMCSWENYNLKGYYEESCIFLQILNNIKDKIKMYEVRADLTKYGKNFFQNAEQLFQYISHPQNIIINTQTNIITVVGTHPIKKSESFQLLKFNMQEIKLVKDDFKFLQLLSLCQDTNFDIQKGGNLRYILGQLIKQINFIVQTNVTVDTERVISKINYLGNQMSGVQFKTTDLFDKYQEISNRTTKIEEQVNRIKQKTQKNFQAKSQQTKYFMKKFMNQFRIVDQQLKSFQKFLGYNSYRNIAEQFERDKQERNQKKINERIINQVDKSADFLKHFKINGKKFSKVEDIFPTMLIGSKSLIKRQEFKIIIREKGAFHNIYPGVCVGIVDSKHKHKQSCDNNDSVIEYSCAGKLFEGNKYLLTEGNGFQNGDQVHVKVNFQQGTIVWLINGKQSCKHTSRNVINKEIDWRPYVFMRDKGDSVEWVLQE